LPKNHNPILLEAGGGKIKIGANKIWNSNRKKNHNPMHVEVVKERI
jgi:hypothetical protein